MKSHLVQTTDITVAGRQYTVACPPSDEPRLRQLADVLDERVSKLAMQFKNAGGSLSENKLLLMAALGLVDELAEANANILTLEEKMVTSDEGLTGAETEILAGRLQKITARIHSIADKVGITSAS